MLGFDRKWKELPDFITGVSREFWDARGLAEACKTFYDPEITQISPQGEMNGTKNVARAALSVIHELPELSTLCEDIIWTGERRKGFASSHRQLCRTNPSAAGPFGKAAQEPLTFRTIVDSSVKNNIISKEWLVRDYGAVVRQMGMRADKWALGKLESGQMQGLLSPEDLEKLDGVGNSHPAAERLDRLLSGIMNASFSVIGKNYEPAAELAYPGGKSAYGYAAAEKFWLPLRAAFPGAKFKIHQQIGREDANLSPRAAIRWSLCGTHSGWGAFGPPSGAEVLVMGITQVEFGQKGIRREWTLYDETAIWGQILRHKGLGAEEAA